MAANQYTIEVDGQEVYRGGDYDKAYDQYDSLKTQTRGEIILKYDGDNVVRRPSLAETRKANREFR